MKKDSIQSNQKKFDKAKNSVALKSRGSQLKIFKELNTAAGRATGVPKSSIQPIQRN